jgi:valyl-tRNA synthetase
VNKLYNATRFVLMAISDGTEVKPLSTADYPKLKLEDRWILTRLSRVAAEVTSDYEKYRVAELSQTLYRFLWNEVCDWYLECLKPRLYAESNSEEKKLAASVVATVLDGVLRLLHPVMPFVTEELWNKLPGKKGSIMKASWPKPQDYPVDEAAVKDFEFLQEVVTAIRTSRSEISIPPSEKVKVAVSGDSNVHTAIPKFQNLIKFLARVDEIGGITTPPVLAVSVFPIANGDVYLLAGNFFDPKKEVSKKKAEIEKLEKYASTLNSKLSNADFSEKAPPNMVEAEKLKLQEAKEKITHVTRNLKLLENLP